MPVLRRVEGAYIHVCPGCDKEHVIPVGEPYAVRWSFDGNIEAPSFVPSVKHTLRYRDEPARICHYFIRNGQIDYCLDSTHHLAGKIVPLPEMTSQGQG